MSCVFPGKHSVPIIPLDKQEVTGSIPVRPTNQSAWSRPLRKWQALNRFVRKGEKGIAIFAPLKYKKKLANEDGEEETLTSLRGFRVVYVFDISQTDGEPLEDLDAVRPKLLDGDAPEGIWDALVARAKEAAFEVIRDRKRSENGYCDFVNKEIGVRPDVTQAQAVKTLVHELAHALLHGDGEAPPRGTAEIEVESVAFVVLDAVGLSSDDYSFPYVARWSSGDVEKLRETGERVVSCARNILDGLAGETIRT